MTTLVLEEIEYRKHSHKRHLRCQLLQIPDGWTLSAVEEVGLGPASLRGYEGGWQFPSRIYTRRKSAERNLLKNGWSPITQSTLRR